MSKSKANYFDYDKKKKKAFNTLEESTANNLDMDVKKGDWEKAMPMIE